MQNGEGGCETIYLLVKETLDAVELLLKKHEAFERSAATQEERFLALEKLTAVWMLNLCSLV